MFLVEKINQFSSRKLIFLICLVGFLVYFNSLFNGFVWDDEEQIVKNPLVQNLGNLPQIFTSSTFYGGGAAPTGWFYRPMMTLFYLLNYSIWGANPFGFHLFQALIHLINASFVFLIFQRLLVLEKYSKPKLISLLVSLIFVVHPANVEAVAYVAALQESLYTLFALLSFWILLKIKNQNGQAVLLVGCLVLLALLAKETAIFLVPLIFLFLYLYQKQRLIYWTVIFPIIFAVYFLLRLGVAQIPLVSVNVGPVAQATLMERLTSLPYELVSYFRIILFPKDLFISQHKLITQLEDFRFWGYLVFLLLVVFTLAWFWFKEKSRLFLFFSFWFFGSLSLVLNIVPLDMSVAERWLYFPLIGFLGMMTFFLAKISRNWPKILPLIFFVLLGVIFILSGRTIARNRDWHDGLSLYSHDIKFNQEAFDLENNYGVELFRVGQIEEAKKHFERSIELYPRWWFAYNNLGAVYEKEGDLPKAQALYEKTIKISDYYLAYENLAFLLVKRAAFAEAVSFLEKAVGQFPQNPRLRLAFVLAYWEMGQFDQAQTQARVLYFLEPKETNRALLEAMMKEKKN